jgi:hypothetical protein
MGGVADSDVADNDSIPVAQLDCPAVDTRGGVRFEVLLNDARLEAKLTPGEIVERAENSVSICTHLPSS